MWSDYIFERSPCLEECCRRPEAHKNNYWVCKPCLAQDAASELTKLLRFCEKDSRKKGAKKGLGAHSLKYRKQFVKMGGVIRPFSGKATPTCPDGCCWSFTRTTRSPRPQEQAREQAQ